VCQGVVPLAALDGGFGRGTCFVQVAQGDGRLGTKQMYTPVSGAGGRGNAQEFEGGRGLAGARLLLGQAHQAVHVVRVDGDHGCVVLTGHVREAIGGMQVVHQPERTAPQDEYHELQVGVVPHRGQWRRQPRVQSAHWTFPRTSFFRTRHRNESK